jgi:hypothetical protein
MEAAIQIDPVDAELDAGKPALLSAAVQGPTGKTEYQWSLVAPPPACAGGLRDPAAAATEYTPPAGCSGIVTLKLTARRGGGQVDVTKVLRVRSAPTPSTPTGPVVDVPLANRFAFQDDFTRGGMRVLDTSSRERLRVTFESDGAPREGFAGICLRLARPADVEAYPNLAFTLEHASGSQRVHIKLERPDSSCPECQCRIYDAGLGELPRDASGLVRLGISSCDRDLRAQVSRVCLGAEASTWDAGTSRVSLELHSMRFAQ